MSIFVESRIKGPMDELWRLTQDPEQHERWDLRFSSITYDSPPAAGEPQRFRYATRLGFGLQIEGWGETAGQRGGDGRHASALRFGSEDPRSLIREGSGYWKYEQLEGGQLRFVTGYDYQVRWGAAGRLFDRLVFRPLIGWATAWSFDRLRLWIEEGLDPRRAAREAQVHAICAASLAFVWIWHGLVPKLLGPHPEELAMMVEAGVSPAWAGPMVMLLGVAELAFGLIFLPASRQRWPWRLTILAMIAATITSLLGAPERALAAFNPVTLNLLMVTVAAVGLIQLEGLPSARRCRRERPAKSNPADAAGP